MKWAIEPRMGQELELVALQQALLELDLVIVGYTKAMRRA